LLLRTAGLPASGPNEVDYLPLRRGGEVQPSAAEPADHARQRPKAVEFRRRDERDREMTFRDDRSDPALSNLANEGREGSPGIRYADRP
jgi:hypothetical protein